MCVFVSDFFHWYVYVYLSSLAGTCLPWLLENMNGVFSGEDRDHLRLLTVSCGLVGRGLGEDDDVMVVLEQTSLGAAVC